MSTFYLSSSSSSSSWSSFGSLVGSPVGFKDSICTMDFFGNAFFFVAGESVFGLGFPTSARERGSFPGIQCTTVTSLTLDSVFVGVQSVDFAFAFSLSMSSGSGIELEDTERCSGS